MSSIKRFLMLEWEIIAGVAGAVAAIVMHFLHVIKIDVLLTISVVLVAVLVIRDLRRERLTERMDTGLQRTEAEVKELQGNLNLVLHQTNILNEIAERLKGVKVHVCPSRETVYTTILKVITTASRSSAGEKQILLAALHGHSGSRISVPSSPIPAFEAFDKAMDECIMSSGPDMWTVRYIFNITTEARLNTVLQLLQATKNADGFEVRAFSIPEAIPHLSPLVVGAEDVFLAIEDPRYYRVMRAIHINGHDAASLATEYFNSLWNDMRTFKMRTAVGIDTGEIEHLRAALRKHRAGEADGEASNPG